MCKTTTKRHKKAQSDKKRYKRLQKDDKNYKKMDNDHNKTQNNQRYKKKHKKI